MPDGRITFETRLDNSQLQKDLKATEKKILKSQAELTKAKEAKIPLVEQAEELGVKLDNAKAKLYELQKQQARIAANMRPDADPLAYMDAAARKKDVDAALKDQEKQTDKLQKKWDGIEDKIDRYDAQIKRATADLKANQAEAGKLSAKLTSRGAKAAEAIDKAGESAKKFGHRLAVLGKRILIFSVAAQAFRAIKEYMSSLLRTNEEYTSQLALLKGALMTAFQPIYEFALPGILAVLKALTAIVNVVGNVLSLIFGKTAKQSADNAKALNAEAKAISGVGSAAKEAEKSLASFDEINRLDSADASGGGGGGGVGSAAPDFSAFDTTEYKRKIDELTAILSGALLALGAILTFSGVNRPLGIALMAAGAVGLVAVARENWDGITQLLKGPLGAIVGLMSGALLVLGAILAFSSVSLPLGIALMAAGAAGLATVTALNWETIRTALQGEVGQLMALISGTLLVLGLILAFSSVNVPLGIALIAAGAAGLVTVSAVNWDAILEKLKGAWENIKNWWKTSVAPVFTVQWWENKFSSIGDGLKSAIKTGINAAIGLINRFTGWISSVLSFNIPPLQIGGRTLFDGFSTSVNIPQIPYLAKGAVLPPNQPFMAMVGDQRHGTNVEAPLDTIKQAVAEVLADGEQNSLLREQLEVLRLILEKCGLKIDGRELAAVVTKYQRQNLRAFGG